MRSASVGRCARILALVASTTMLLLLLAAPVAALEKFATVSVDPEATVDLQTDVLIVTGSVECTGAGSIELPTFASQQIGQSVVTGFGFGSVICTGDGATRTWQTTIVPEFGPFNPGRIDLFIDGQQCVAEGCEPDPIEIQVIAHPLGNVTPPAPPANDEAAGTIALTLDGGAFT